MSGTQATDVTTDARHARFVALVVSIGREAHGLRRPIALTACLSLASALLLWYRGFSSFVFDSTKSFMASAAVLVAAVAPGAFLFWLRGVVRELEILPTLVDTTDVDIDVEVQEPPEEPGAEESEKKSAKEWAEKTKVRAKRWFKTTRARLAVLVSLWDRLTVRKDELLELGCPRRPIVFLARPAAPYIVGTALIITAPLILGAVFSALSWLFS